MIVFLHALLLAVAQDPNPPEDPTLTATFRDGVRMKSSDGNLEILIGAYLGLHYRQLAHRPADNVRTSPDTFLVRQARPELSGTIYKDFDYRLLLDFPSGTASTATGTVLDAYGGWRYWPWLSLRAGQFKEPFGQEQGSPDRLLDFDERSDLDRLVPSRDIGVMLYGKVADGLLSYEAGAFNGQGRAVVDATDNKEVAGRLRTLPFALADDDSFLKRLRIGVAATAGTVTRSSFNGLDFTSMGLNILSLDATAGQIDGPRTRLGAEFAWHAGPCSLRAEVVQRTDTVDIGAFRDRKIRIRGGVVAVTWLLTGEDKPLEVKFDPTHPFDPRTGGWGALEVALRADRVRIDSDIFTLEIASAAGNSGGLSAYWLGLTWYLNRNIRVMPNLIFEHTDDKIRFADGRREDHFYGGILRLQIEF